MEQLKIGTLTLPHRAVFGPMAGFTDAPCRRLMAQHGAGFTVSEMVSGRALVYQDRKTAALLRAEPNDAPYGVQLFGDDPEIMGQAAALIEGEQFDFLDINMGCPAPKIVSAGAGSKLMLDPELCGRIVEQVAAHTTRPVTVKMRKGWDADHITAVECAKACAQAGAAAIAVHARTRAEMYTPGIDLSIIAAVKQAVDVPHGFFAQARVAGSMIAEALPFLQKFSNPLRCQFRELCVSQTGENVVFEHIVVCRIGSRSALTLIIGFLPETNVFPKRHIPTSMHWRCRSRNATHGSLACFRIFLCR